jgi:ferritin-like metal-binding protein YciE
MDNLALSEKTVAVVNWMIELERKCAKTFDKLANAALTPELAKALHPEQTYIQNHYQRLKLITKLLPKGKAPIASAIVINPIKLSKNKSNEQDVELIFIANQFLAMKNNQYELLINLFKLLAEDEATTLLRQTITDNENTQIWINRTLIQLVEN